MDTFMVNYNICGLVLEKSRLIYGCMIKCHSGTKNCGLFIPNMSFRNESN